MFRYRMKFSKTGTARYISHLDLLRAFERAMRRARLPVALSQGFNPHPRLSFAAPLPVGVEGLGEYLEVDLSEQLESDEIKVRLNSSLNPGLKLTGVKELPAGGPALMAQVDRADYTLHLELPSDFSLGDFEVCLEGFLAQTEIKVARKGKDGRLKEIDVRPLIFSIAGSPSQGGLELKLELKTGSSGNVRPEEVVKALGQWCHMPFAAEGVTVTRTGLFGVGRTDLF